MRLNEITFSDAKPIDGYGPGFFRIAGEAGEGPVMVLASGVKSWGGWDDVALLVEAEPLPSASDRVDVLLVGNRCRLGALQANACSLDRGVCVQRFVRQQGVDHAATRGLVLHLGDLLQLSGVLTHH